ncbi:recombination mediator RecR [Patescibacteria group bacterium]
MKLPRPLQRLIDSFERLPGIGPKTASRLAFYLLRVPQEYLDQFGQNLKLLKKGTVFCSICYNVAESDPCSVCADQNRDKTTLCVVEEPLDILALEKTGHYQGVYHVLHGVISPLSNIGPDELYIDQLISRLKAEKIKEIILATNPSMEGEATAMYIANVIRELKTSSFTEASQDKQNLKNISLTRLGVGLPTGGDLEYADAMTVQRALEGRKEY